MLCGMHSCSALTETARKQPNFRIQSSKIEHNLITVFAVNETYWNLTLIFRAGKSKIRWFTQDKHTEMLRSHPLGYPSYLASNA